MSKSRPQNVFEMHKKRYQNKVNLILMLWVIKPFENISNLVNCKFTKEDLNIDQSNYIKIELLDGPVISGEL
jgi:hypothetical protein